MNNKNTFLSFSKMTRRDYGRAALTGILAGIVLQMGGTSIFVRIICDVLFLVGLILAIVWLYKTIQEKRGHHE
jgi:hypothetical protein